MALSIDDALKADDSYLTKVDCPEWGGEVCLVPCSSEEWDVFELTMKLAAGRNDPKQAKGITADLVAACWSDETGKRVPIDPAKIKALAKKQPKVLNRLFAECERICTDVGPAEGNSESSPTEPS